ncbi:MAG TPA: 4-alpha-glucanotransferase [Longimicrobium sp.]|nr:4-alpha-glucanotransferase [Longimicrobium sp.]
MRVTGERRGGILLHPTSLPGDGVGDLGAQAYRFVDWLALAGQTLWQLLPLVAVGQGGSPYNGLSAFAGNTLLISADLLVEDALLDEDEARPPRGLNPERADYDGAARWKEPLLNRAHAAFRASASPGLRAGFTEFREREAEWLDDWSLFQALRDELGGPWTEWPAPLRGRDPGALAQARERLADAVERNALGQFLFDRQWGELRRYANDRGIYLIGDVPIFVAHDSADVWANPGLFELDPQGRPTVVSGVPPDYFSETGQRWGNPLYRWEVMERDGYRWWVERFRRTLRMVDIARIDHFRGFESYWEVPAHEATALHGRWMPGPGTRLFAAVERALGPLPLIAEDLGIITPEVEALRDELRLPGMRVLQFAFGEDDPKNPHLPANYVRETVAYTGTHDNNTALGWYRDEASPRARAALSALAGGGGGEPNWAMIEVVLASHADLAIVPLQDVLGLGTEGRMNTPGSSSGDWLWRFREGALTPDLAARLRDITAASGRLHGEERR